MKTLFILRHAKAEAEQPGQSDHARPLSPRGSEDSRQLARHLQAEGWQPERILCSTAKRTRQTLDELLPAFPADVSLCYDDELYLASTGTLIDQLQQLDPKWQRVMLVGHNPGLHMLARTLAGRFATPDLREKLEYHFPTTALAVLTLPEGMPWSELAPGSADVQAYLAGKAL